MTKMKLAIVRPDVYWFDCLSDILRHWENSLQMNEIFCGNQMCTDIKSFKNRDMSFFIVVHDTE